MKRLLESIKYIIIIYSLPTFTVDQNYLQNLDNKTEDQTTKKCVICMEQFGIKEVLKTLPCCKIYYFINIVHIFHSSCVDEWLRGNNQCPICKSAIYE